MGVSGTGALPLLLAAAWARMSRASGAVQYTGYIVDNYCWNKPNHRGIDGSRLGTAPGTHILHCLWRVSRCRTDGYVALERLAAAAPDGSTYGPKYQLDATGNDLAYQLFSEEQARGGDRRFDEQITINGTATGSSIAVASLCITPRAGNPSGETYCYRPASEASTQTSTSTTTPGGATANATTSTQTSTSTTTPGGATANTTTSVPTSAARRGAITALVLAAVSAVA